MTTGYSGKHATYEPPKTPTKERLLEDLIRLAGVYARSRQACPVGDWKEKCEIAGWELAEAYRAYEKVE